METIRRQIGWYGQETEEELALQDEDGNFLAGTELYFDFPAKKEPTECYDCRGRGTTVADRLKGLDFSPEELQRNGDWDDYVEGEGIWREQTCSRCRGQGCFMETSIDMDKANEHHSKELEMMCQHQDDMYQCMRESQATLWGESGGTMGSPY